MSVVAFVFARGGSKGVARKNLRLLAGKPLLVHAIEAAQAASLVERVIVSTEDAEIAAVARQYGAGVLDRPAELATDESPEWLCWQHAIREIGPQHVDTFVSVPCTAPLRLPEDVDAVIRKLQGGDADAVITVTEARHNPYFNMAYCYSQGHAELLVDTFDCNVGVVPTRRQDAPIVYDVTTVAYAARPAFVLEHSDLWQGDVGAVVIPPERGIDIDTEEDRDDAECKWYRQNGYKAIWQKVAS